VFTVLDTPSPSHLPRDTPSRGRWEGEGVSRTAVPTVCVSQQLIRELQRMAGDDNTHNTSCGVWCTPNFLHTPISRGENSQLTVTPALGGDIFSSSKVDWTLGNGSDLPRSVGAGVAHCWDRLEGTQIWTCVKGIGLGGWVWFRR